MTRLDIGNAIKLLREEHDIALGLLAFRACLPKAAMAKIERGVGEFDIITLDRIAHAFNMEGWQLLRFAQRLQETVDSRIDDQPQLHRETWRAEGQAA